MAGRRALVIDDSQVVRMKVREVLEPMGFEVTDVEDGRVALDILATQEEFDLAFIDVNMPNMNGIEFVVEVKSRGFGSKMAMIMLTTEVNVSLKEQAKNAGVRLWVLKPITPERLKRAVEVVITD